MTNFSCCDHRSTAEIVDYLMSTDYYEIDLLAVVTVLTKRIEQLEYDVRKLNPMLRHGKGEK